MVPRHFINIIKFIVILSVYFILAGVVLAQEGQFAAEVIAINGQAEIKSGGGPYQPAKVRDRLNVGDTIRTLEKSRAKLLFRDESVTVLGDKTTFEINQFNYDPATKQQQSLLKTLEGKIRFTVQKIAGAPDPNTVVETQIMSVGIRGTDGILDSSEPNKVYLFESAFPLKLKNKFTGQTSNLPPGQYAIAGKTTPFQFNAITPQILEQLFKEFRLAYTFEPKNLINPSQQPYRSFLLAQPGDLPTVPLPPVVQQPLPVWHNFNPTAVRTGK